MIIPKIHCKSKNKIQLQQIIITFQSVPFHTSHQRLKLWYITNVPHLWLAKIFTAFQQEFTVNNSGM